MKEDPCYWVVTAHAAAGDQQRVVNASSLYQQSSNSVNKSSSAAATAAAQASQLYPTPCHKVVIAPSSGTQQHVIVTAPASNLQQYSALQMDALGSQGSKQRTIIITPVSKNSELALHLLSLPGYVGRCVDVLLVSQHFFNICVGRKESKALFRDIEADIHSSLTGDSPVALASPKLSGFVHLRGPTLLVQPPKHCSQVLDIRFQHVVALVNPTSDTAFSPQQVKALVETAVPACQELLALPGLPTWPNGKVQQSAGVLEESYKAAYVSLLELAKSTGMQLNTHGWWGDSMTLCAVMIMP